MSGEVPRIVRLADARRMAWKNGGGETVEIAVHPPGASLDAFGWRVSLARITGDGPFSTFRDVDRTFAVLEGRLVLTVGAGRPTRLEAGGEPVGFAGEAPCGCRLLAGPATALNVMTRRGSFVGAVTALDPAQGLPRAAGAVTLLVCAEGEVGTAVGTLGRHDVLVVPPGTAAGIGPGATSARAMAVSLQPAPCRPAPAGR